MDVIGDSTGVAGSGCGRGAGLTAVKGAAAMRWKSTYFEHSIHKKFEHKSVVATQFFYFAPSVGLKEIGCKVRLNGWAAIHLRRGRDERSDRVA